MGYADLFGQHHLALLYDWLQGSRELYVDLDRPHSGGLDNSLYFIQDLPALKSIVSQETHPEVCIHIFRKALYPICGEVDEALLQTALQQIPDRQWFSILSTGDTPLAPCEKIGWGECHDELREELIRLKKRKVRIGQDPFDQPEAQFFEPLGDVLVLGSYKHPHVYTSTNLPGYSRFDIEPHRYRPYIDFWHNSER